MPQWEQIATTNEIEEGGRISVFADDLPALLIQAGGAYYCIEDLCPHDGQPLTDGVVKDAEITCPRHGARFDLTNGYPKGMPATEPVRVFETDVRDGAIFVDVE